MSQDRLTWLADVLRAAGVPVVEHAGWKSRGRPTGDFHPRGIMLHHDASPAGASSGAVDVILNGRAGLPGPLSQLWLDYAGRWHVVAAGRANHAGIGQWGSCPANAGNAYFLGIETDHTANEQWSAGQSEYGIRGLIALCDKLGIRDNATELRKWLCAHKEYAPTRKVDPDPLNMTTLRATVLRGIQPVTPVDPDPVPDRPDQEDGFVDQIIMTSTTEQTVQGGTWSTLRTQDEADQAPFFAALSGPTKFVLTLAVTTRAGATPGKSVMLRAVNTEGTDTIKHAHPIEQCTATDDGPQHFAYTAQGDVPAGQWLRVQINPDEDLTITRTDTRVTSW